MDQERGLEHFHDSESGDVYDLYLACHGAMRGELLDVRKLDELTAPEREVLDVARLRQVWEHTASGCPQCKCIIRTLNATRAELRRREGDPPRNEPRPPSPEALARAEEKASGRD